jgi:hypothetical protein
MDDFEEDELELDDNNESIGVAFASGTKPVPPDAPPIDPEHLERLIAEAVAHFRGRGFSEAWIARELEEYRRATGRD